MKLIEFIKLLIKHKIVLIAIPLLFGLLAILLTNNPERSYYSQTLLYTGLASGSSIEMDKKFNYYATNIAFDNLINTINSRETQEEVAIRLLSQHLLLEGPSEAYISAEAYEDLKKIIPEELYALIVKSNSNINNKKNTFSGIVPKTVTKQDYEATVSNLLDLMHSDNTNFVYSLLNFEHPYYSLEAISEVKAERISTSDLVKLSYETEDPGICKQTLAIYNEVCIKKYKNLKENGSDAVVKYFESQLSQSENKLKSIEERLLKFNQDYSIINYYEQSKAVAIVKEDMEVEYNKKRAELAGSEASTKRLEQKLEIQELVQQKSDVILENKKRLGELNYEIAITESKTIDQEIHKKTIDELKKKAAALQKEIKTSVDQLYTFQNSIEGIPSSKILPDWVDKVVETEDLKAKLEVLDKSNKKFQKQYEMYAPAGANLKRIEREIEVAEQEYLEILHGLNLAKLKFQDTQLSSNLKALDPPYFPLKPIPSKRKIIIIAIVLVSGIFLLGIILFMEFFDNTLKNVSVASDKLKINALGMLPKIFKTNNKLDFSKIQDRLLEFLMQNLNHALNKQGVFKATKTIIVFSTRNDEGKTVLAGNIARKLKAAGKSVLVLNHSLTKKQIATTNNFTWLHRLFGYQDLRNDYSQPILADVKDYLNETEYKKYEINTAYKNAKSYTDLNISNVKTTVQQPDYVVIELPNVIETSYPSYLFEESDMALLVCRSNRLWSKADENILENIKELTGSKLQFIINGVEIDEVETLLGELPKIRSKARRKIKNILRFQFYSQSHI